MSAAAPVKPFHGSSHFAGQNVAIGLIFMINELLIIAKLPCFDRTDLAGQAVTGRL
jgi:hypothetical protein